MSGRSTFHLSVDRSEGALERVLSVVRRRGLDLQRFCASPAGDGRWDIAIDAAASEGEIGLALRQLTALIDVRTARLEDAQAS
ncbi:MAG: ACT domain-containing protein [Chloroflexota bacterium]|nr:ACT domain-containing protein [Chloroflexota bacterium]MDE3193351.1 ACT domain-containing protein [Chloroflexota bacterium]